MILRLALIAACVSAAPVAADTVIAARTIRAQSILAPGDVTLVSGNIPGAYADLGDVVGQEARVALYAGRPVRMNEVGPPAIIARNQIVTLIYRTGGLLIAADGRSLDRAGIGDHLRVMNLASRQTVTGFVHEDGSVTVAPGASRLPDFPSN